MVPFAVPLWARRHHGGSSDLVVNQREHYGGCFPLPAGVNYRPHAVCVGCHQACTPLWCGGIGCAVAWRVKPVIASSPRRRYPQRVNHAWFVDGWHGMVLQGF